MSKLAYDYSYNSDYMPSAPFVDVTLSTHGADSPIIEVEAQIDSASDNTAIPAAILTRLDAENTDTQIMRGIDEKPTLVDLYSVTVTLANQRYTVDAVELKQGKTVILGRDILNYFSITLDGPSLTTIIPVDD